MTKAVELGAERDAWVLFIDIDGFSERVRRPTGRARLFEAYMEVVKSITDDRVRRTLMAEAGPVMSDVLAGVIEPAILVESARAASQFATASSVAIWRDRIRIISDTIIVIFDGNPDPHAGEPHSPSSIEVVASSASAALWKAGLPHRGSIAHGSCLVDYKYSIILGDPIVEAYRWQAAQDWLGISYTREAAGKVTPAMSFSDEFATAAMIPSKQGPDVETRAILPVSQLARNVAMANTSFYHAHRETIADKARLPENLRRMIEAIATGSGVATPAEIISGFQRAREDAINDGAPKHAIARYGTTERIWRQLGAFEKADLIEKMSR